MCKVYIHQAMHYLIVPKHSALLLLHRVLWGQEWKSLIEPFTNDSTFLHYSSKWTPCISIHTLLR